MQMTASPHQPPSTSLLLVPPQIAFSVCTRTVCYAQKRLQVCAEHNVAYGVKVKI